MLSEKRDQNIVKVLLVNPTRVGIDSFSTPPLHLMYLKKALKLVPGCSCKIIDVNYEINKLLNSHDNVLSNIITEKKRQLEGEYIKKILQMDFDILGIGGIVPCYNFSERLVKALSEIKHNIWIIVGGGLGIPLKALWLRTKIDFLVEGDGELIIVDIVKSYPDKEKARSIRGVYYRSGNGWEGTGPSLPANLDYIAYPDWEEIDYDYFMGEMGRWLRKALPKSFSNEIKSVRLLPIVMTRGCPYSCTFCFHFNRFHRKHSVEYMMDYLVHLKKNYDVNMLQTWDDLIIVDRKWFLELCRMLKKKRIDLKIFMSGGKPNLIDSEMLYAMKEAGVMRISYGIESGSSVILKEMKKMATVEENFNAVKSTIKEGIFTHLNMVAGMPSESIETLKDTKSFLLKCQEKAGINSDNIYFSYATAYPGSELFDYAMNKGLVSDMRKYVVEQNKGVGEYSLDLCGLGKRRLQKFIEGIFITMDLNELKRKFNLYKALKLFFISIPRFIIKAYFPKYIVLLFKNIIGLWRHCGSKQG